MIFRSCLKCLYVCMSAKSLQSCLTLCITMDCRLLALLSLGFSRQEYWSGFSCPPPGDFPDQGLNPCLLWLLICRQILYY